MSSIYPRGLLLCDTPSRSSHGNTGHDGDCVGRRRRLRRRLTWPSPGEVASKGPPAATDERCVPDGHIGGTGEGLPGGEPRSLVGANAAPWPEPATRSGTDANRNRRRGAKAAPRIIFERHGHAPRFPTSLPGGEERSLKRPDCESRAWRRSGLAMIPRLFFHFVPTPAP